MPWSLVEEGPCTSKDCHTYFGPLNYPSVIGQTVAASTGVRRMQEVGLSRHHLFVPMIEAGSVPSDVEARPTSSLTCSKL
jgi:hypothetical protein